MQSHEENQSDSRFPLTILTLKCSHHRAGCSSVFKATTAVQRSPFESAVAENQCSSYARVFARLVETLTARPDESQATAQTIFLARLEWSKENDADFVNDVGTRWHNRIQGLDPSLSMYSVPQAPHMLDPERHCRIFASHVFAVVYELAAARWDHSI